MMRRRALPAILLLSLGAAPQPPLSATRPATGPTTTLPEVGSPRFAITSLYSALSNGNIPQAEDLLYFTDAREQERAHINLTNLYAPLWLMHAMENRFGPGAQKLFSQASLVTSADETLRHLADAQITETNDTAVIGEKRAATDPNAENETTGIRLKRVGSRWKVVAASFQDIAAEIPASQLDSLRALAQATRKSVDTVRQQLEAGKYASAAEAYKDYQDRLAASARTRPAPRPPTP